MSAGGFYYTAVRGSRAEALRELGARIGASEGLSAPVALDSWDAAVGALLGLGSEREVLVVLGEYPYLLEHTPELDSVIQRALGTRRGARGERDAADPVWLGDERDGSASERNGSATRTRGSGPARFTIRLLAPIVEGLTAARFLDRVQDPIRDNRPTYHPGDPLIRFHYAAIRKHQSRLARHGADTNRIWSNLRDTFDSQVVGPTFESLARYWAAHFADPGEIAGEPDHIGRTTMTHPDGTELQIDVLVAADDARIPSERTVRGIGEAKAGERIGIGRLRRLERARSALGERAEEAKLLLFACASRRSW